LVGERLKELKTAIRIMCVRQEEDDLTNGTICGLWPIPIMGGQIMKLIDNVFDGNMNECRRGERSRCEARH
jgi:hypothetical protein